MYEKLIILNFYYKIMHMILLIHTAWRIVSNANKLTKHVTCSTKSTNNAIPAYRAKALTAGISDNPPKKTKYFQYF